VSPDKRGRPKKKAPARAERAIVRRPSSDDAHEITYFKRPSDGSVPGREFLASAPSKVRATMAAVLIAVAKAPPKRFAGGGYWEAMHGEMTGWFEVRVDGPGKAVHYRLFCRLDYDAQGADKPFLVVISGLAKPVRTVLSDADYAAVRDLGREYLSVTPRSVL
jgi:hypothetical protein